MGMIVAVVAVVTSFSFASTAPKDRRAELESIALAYEQNRLALSAAVARFSYAVGAPAPAEVILQPKWKPTAVANGFYAFAKGRLRYEIVFTEEDMKKNVQKVDDNEYSTGGLGSFRILGKGDLRLYNTINALPDVAAPMHAAVIEQTPTIEQDVVFPLGVGFKRIMVRRLLQDIDGYLAGLNSDVQLETLEPNHSFQGRPCTRVSFVTKSVRHEYLVDRERGAIPLKVRHVSLPSGETELEIISDDVRRVGGQCWLPHRQAIRGTGFGYLLTVESISVETPQLDVFKLEFPAPQRVQNHKEMVSYSPRTTWSLDDLPARNSKEAKPVAVAKQGPSARGGDPETVAHAESRTGFYLVVAGVIAALSGMSYITWRVYSLR